MSEDNRTILVDENEPGWLTTEQAAQRLKISRRMFELRWRNGDISCNRYKVEGDRSYYYNPADLRSAEQDDAADMGLLDTPTAALLAQAYTHNEVLMRQTHDMMLKLMAGLSDENSHLRARCHELETTHTELIKAREDSLNDQHARDLATKMAEAEVERKDAIVNKLFEMAPKVLQTHMVGKLKDKAVQFVSGISAEQINMLLQLNAMSDEGDKILTAEQVAILQELLAAKQQAAEQQAAEQPKESTDE